MSREWEDKAQMEREFAKDTTDNGLLSKICKEVWKYNNMKICNLKYTI